ncbi:diguanylate cyclase [Halobacillus litoralis]|uniref:GGDEF domain-containing protein n=1 Tax=Halobacillus litoralis TaxID=45668 RepID=UPI001CD65B73|nr:diguanylate cyclase [Halobacillus litoralis]MCA0970871.1 diguanylate cyclase [Halobacillus litoralis]
MIVKELISNLAILTSLLFLYTISTYSTPLRSSSSVQQKCLTGALAGVLSNILMQYSMHFESVIVDLRHIPVILVAYYGGPIPGFAAMTLTIIGRLFFGINTESMLALVFIVATTVFTLLIKRFRLPQKQKVFLAVTFSNITYCVMISFLSVSTLTLATLMISYMTISYTAGFLSFYIIEYVRRSQRMFRTYQNEASKDGLTGLNNVRQFDQIFNLISLDAEHRDEKLSLAYIDIDHFKDVNDTYGHREGDQILKQLSDILKNSVRSIDVISRNGGEEFTAILVDCSKERGILVSEKIRKNVEKHPFVLTNGATIKITVSVGIACYRDTTFTREGLIEDADKALYEAKRSGRNKVVVYQSNHLHVNKKRPW